MSELGAVVTHAARTSRSGFDAEWLITGILTVDGYLINPYEVFHEKDLETALGRFETRS